MNENLHPQRFVLPRGGRGRLVIDSTEITRDWLLRGLDFRVLRFLSEIHQLEICVPAPVLLEVEANHARARDQLEAAARRVQRESRRLGAVPSMQPVGTWLDDAYPRGLKNALELLQANVLPWPSIGHEKLVMRAVARRPPFDANGGGYRDALVWLSALITSSSGDHLFFASRDAAFAGPDGRLALFLQEEAISMGIEAILVPDLGAWATVQVPWAKDLSLPEVAAQVRDDRFGTHLAQSDFPSDLMYELEEVGLPPSARLLDVTAESVYDLRRIGIASMGPGETLVKYQVEVELVLLVEVDVEDADAVSAPYRGPVRTGRVETAMDARVTVTIGAVHDDYDDGVGWQYMDVKPARSRHWPSTGPRHVQEDDSLFD